MESLVGTVFEGCGVESGVEFWRVKGRRLVRAVAGDEVRDGVLRKLDCVLALHAIGDDRADRWVIHTWRGREAGIVNSGFAGTQAHKLSNLLGREASSKRISLVENLDQQETDDFRALFPGDLRVLDGKFVFEPPPGTDVERRADSRVAAAAAKAETTKVPRCWALVDGAYFEAVAASRRSTKDAATLVVDGGAGVVYSWAGARASRVDRALCEEIARRIAKREYGPVEYPPAGGEAVHVVQGQDDEGPLVAALSDDACGAKEEKRDTSLRVWEWSCSDGGEWLRRDVDARGDPFGKKRRAAAATLRRDGLYAIDAGSQAWIWKGRNFRQQRDTPPPEPPLPTERKRPSFFRGFEAIADRFEPVMFREHFVGWEKEGDDDDDLEVHFYNPDMHHLRSNNKRYQRRSIETEARRMTQAGVGSLEAVSDASDAWLTGDGLAARAGDDQRASLCLDLASEAKVELYKVDDSQKDQPLVKCQCRDDVVVLSSSDMAVFVITAKQGCVKVLYTWEGSTASLKARAAAGLRVKTLLRRTSKKKGENVPSRVTDLAFFEDHGGGEGDEQKDLLQDDDDHAGPTKVSAVEHQLYCFENAEPPLLLAALGAPLLVLRGRCGGGYLRPRSSSSSEEAEKVRSVRVARAPGVDGRDDRLIKATEESLDTTRRFFDQRAAYVLVDRDAVRVVEGRRCDDAVLAKAKAVAADDRLPSWLATSEREGPIVRGVYLDDDKTTPTSPSWSGDVSSEAPFDVCSVEDDEEIATRPARLFEVSRAKREVGGIFATDVGRTYRQGDLAPRGCYVLDAGCKVFAWIGRDATDDEGNLALCVAQAYADAVPSMLLYREANASSSSSDNNNNNNKTVAERLDLKRIQRKREAREHVVAPTAVEVAVVTDGREPPAFVRCFQGWLCVPPEEEAKTTKRWASFLDEVKASKAPLAATVLGEEDNALGGDDDTTGGDTPPEPEEPSEKTWTKKKRRPSQQRVVSAAAGKSLKLLERLPQCFEVDGDLLRVKGTGSPFAFDESLGRLEDVIAAVHDGAVDFAAWAYESKKVVKFAAKGTDGLAGLRSAFVARPTVCYGLLRQHHPLNPSVAVFALLTWIPDGVSPLLRGAVNAHRAVVRDIFAPVHVDITAEDPAALGEDVVQQAFHHFVTHTSV